MSTAGIRLGDLAKELGLALDGDPDVEITGVGPLGDARPGELTFLRAAAYAAGLLGVSVVVPMHYGTFPILAGTPAQLGDALRGTGIEVADLTTGGGGDSKDYGGYTIPVYVDKK